MQKNSTVEETSNYEDEIYKTVKNRWIPLLFNDPYSRYIYLMQANENANKKIKGVVNNDKN